MRVERGAFRAIGAVPCVPSNQESPSRGSLGLPVVAPHQGNKTQRSACRRGTKVPAPSCDFAGAAPGEDCHGQADQRVAAAELHGRVHRERHIRRNPAPLSRRANLVRAELRLSGSRSRFWPPKASGGQWSRRLSFQAAPPPQPWPPVRSPGRARRTRQRASLGLPCWFPGRLAGKHCRRKAQ
jgi:hypothetical protein